MQMQAELDWDRNTQGQLLAAFYLGYMLAQLPAGFIAARFGPRNSVSIGIVCSTQLSTYKPTR